MTDSTTTPRPITTGPLAGSRKVHVAGRLHPQLRVPMREITLGPTTSGRGGAAQVVEENAPVLVYDTSGPYTDETITVDVRQGLPTVRLPWILERSDSGEIEGRAYVPADDGRSTAPAGAAQPL